MVFSLRNQFYYASASCASRCNLSISFLSFLGMVSTKIVVARNKDEYVPTTIPTNIANTNPRIDSPPKINMINNNKINIKDVLMVLVNVVFTVSFLQFYEYTYFFTT